MEPPTGVPQPVMPTLQELWDKLQILEADIDGLESAQDTSLDLAESLHQDLAAASLLSGQEYEWTTELLFAIGQDADSVSMAVLPDGRRCFSYRNALFNLHYYAEEGSDGNWTTQPVSSEGFHSQLRISPSGHPAIAYYSVTSGALKFLQRSAQGVWGSEEAIPTSEVVPDHAPFDFEFDPVTEEPCLIARHQTNGTLRLLRRAHAGTWSHTTAFFGVTNVFMYPQMEMWNDNGTTKIHLMFRRTLSNQDAVGYHFFDGTEWTGYQTVESPGNSVGLNLQMRAQGPEIRATYWRAGSTGGTTRMVQYSGGAWANTVVPSVNGLQSDLSLSAGGDAIALGYSSGNGLRLVSFLPSGGNQQQIVGDSAAGEVFSFASPSSSPPQCVFFHVGTREFHLVESTLP